MRAPQTPTRILVGTDLTARCDRALGRAMQLARQWGAEVLVVHAVDPGLSARHDSFAAPLPSWRRSLPEGPARRALASRLARSEHRSQYVRRRLGFVLARHVDRVRRVSVRLRDDDSRCGRPDKYCRIEGHLRDASVAMGEDLGSDVYTCVDRAADRLESLVARHLDRSRHVADPERIGVRPARRRRLRSLTSS